MAELDDIMESASQALGRMDYLTCEALCLEALGLARSRRDWAYYGRILLPLQEARRHRRMIAADGAVRLGTSDLEGDPVAWLAGRHAACIVVTHPAGAPAAAALVAAARQERRYIEVLLADNPATEAHWTIRSFAAPALTTARKGGATDGPAVSCVLARPPGQWIDQWVAPLPHQAPQRQGRSPADWFIDATEALGNAALAHVDARASGGAGGAGVGAGADGGELQALEACLEVVSDHEIIHQRLGTLARALSLRERCP